MSESIAVVATIVAHPEQRQAVQDALKQAVTDTLGERGCEQYALQRDRANLNCFVMIERWSDQASFDCHANGHAFTTLSAALEGRATLEVAFYVPIIA